MKKFFSVLAAWLFVGSFLFVPAGAGAVSDLDQYQTDGIGGNYINTHQFTGQSFKPTKNRLNKISVKLKGDGKAVFAQMTKTGDSTLLLPGSPIVSTTVDADYKWYSFAFSDVAVTPGNSYTIWIATFPDTDSYWAINTSAEDMYVDGKAYIDCATWISNDSCDHWVATADWAFKTYGYSTTAPAPVVAPAAELPKNTTEVKPTTVAPAALAVPVLKELKKNEAIVVLPVEEVVKVTKAGTLTLAGTSVAGASVSLSWGDKTYPATTAADGTWKAIVVASDLKVGDYTVKAKTVKGTTESKEVELLKFRVEDNAAPEEADTAAAGWYTNMNLYWGIAGGVILLAAIILLVVYALKHRKLKKHVDSLGDTDKTALEEKTEEETKE